MTDHDPLDAAFAALAHPARRAMLARLAEGQATVNELAAPFDMSLPAVSKHIRVLEQAGFISRGRDAQFRPCRLNAAAMEAVADWTDQYRHIWTARFDAMDAAIKNLEGTDNG
jgi:DNA-binding transcriptional ArsR family regulator